MVKKLTVFFAVLVATLTLAFPSIASALPSGEVWESYSTGVDADYEVYGNIWYGQTFTVAPESHSASQVRILAYREGTPGTVTISIRETDDAGLPTGVDLTSGTYDGDTMTDAAGGAWYGVTLTEDSLDYDETYAIIIRAEAGDAANSLHVRLDGSAASYAGGSEVMSSNGGITWSADTDDDLHFEVYGAGLVELTQAQVFRGYIEDEDMIFVMQYYNVYTPYYPIQDSRYYFTLQLRCSNGTTVIAQTTCNAWGYKPAAIYLSADSAAGLSDGGAYRVYIYSDVTEEPTDYYTLTSADWRGEDITLMDTWILNTAREMADYYGVDMTQYAADGEKLNDEGSVIFAIGISGLQYVRPGMFETIVYSPEYTPEEWTNAYETDTTWSDQVGPEAADVLTDIGDITGQEARNVGGLIVVGLYLLCVLLIIGTGGDAIAASLLCVPFIIGGAWLHLLTIGIIAVIAGIGVLLMVYRFWWSKA